MRWSVALLLAGLAVAGCLDEGEPDIIPDDPDDLGDGIPEGTIRFLAIGDQGQGNDDQFKVARAMKDVCLELGCQFVITTGDNIYPDGPRNEFDPQFVNKFEKPYKDIDLPFYLSLGNHDNGNGAGSDPRVGDFEVAYSYLNASKGERLTDKWNMPARYYTFTKELADFVALDSGPQVVAMPAVYEPGSRGEKQSQWLAAEMPKLKSPWKIAFAHHPYISNGQHGNAGIYDNVPTRGLAYKNMLEDHICPDVDVFIAGHDHDLQWLEPVQGCGDTEFIVTGAASKTRTDGETGNAARFEVYSTLGFFWIEIDATTFTGIVFDGDGNELFRHQFTK